jgi:hypothetical protein
MALLTGLELADALQLEYAGSAVPVLDQVANAASDLIGYLITASALLAEPPACKEAALSVGSEIFQARTAAGGEAVAIDFTPAPRMSVWVTRRVMALLAPYLNMKGVVG